MYRISRNIEASLIDAISAALTADGWTGVRTEKSFAEVYEGTLPCICVSVVELRPQKLEIGSKTNIKYFTVNIKIFATSDGQRLDLADWLSDKIEDDFVYSAYNITNGVVSSKVASGKIVLMKWFDNRKELTNTENLVKADRYRHLLSFECIVAN